MTKWTWTNYRTKVSIPNGMEFYPRRRWLGCRCLGFNSQRDGILHYLIRVVVRVISVSIPNGMEFYRKFLLGIVRNFSVSIPNGMEFYFSFEIQLARYSEFQFPTGWNSTWVSVGAGASSECFNSQRDGILLKFRKQERQHRKFQFPTGWNSTSSFLSLRCTKSSFNSQRDGILRNGVPLLKDIPICFNSQRDGILPRCMVYRRATDKVSIPNGMEFYRILKTSYGDADYCFNSQRDGILLN